MTTDQHSCLIVEDDEAFSTLLLSLASENGLDCRVAPTIAEGLRQIDSTGFDLVILDNQLPDGSGETIFRRLKASGRLPLTVVLTGVPQIAQAVELTRQGLFDYLTKPIAEQDFIQCLERARLRITAAGKDSEPGRFVCGTPEMRNVREQLLQAARHPAATVLLTGETGSGKDVASRFLHESSFTNNDPARPFVPVNCATLPSEMFEAELFGSEKGAYTGADRKRFGLVDAAARGTLFLDEIAEVPLGLQAKLLQLLETREFRSLGSTETKRFEGRLVAATNKSLRDEVRAGRFRQDLLYRIDVFSIHIPPLRSRKDEVIPLAESLLGQLSGKYDRRRPSLRPEDHTVLRDYPFPGNVRELRNLIERSLLRTPIESHWLEIDRNWLLEPPPEQSGDERSLPPPTRHETGTLVQHEFNVIRDALSAENGGIRRAAKRLGISHQSLLRRLQRWPELRAIARGRSAEGDDSEEGG